MEVASGWKERSGGVSVQSSVWEEGKVLEMDADKRYSIM